MLSPLYQTPSRPGSFLWVWLSLLALTPGVFPLYQSLFQQPLFGGGSLAGRPLSAGGHTPAIKAQWHAVLTQFPASASSPASSVAGSRCHRLSHQAQLVLKKPNFSSFPKGGCLSATNGPRLCQYLHGNQGPQLPAVANDPEPALLAGLVCRRQDGCHP